MSAETDPNEASSSGVAFSPPPAPPPPPPVARGPHSAPRTSIVNATLWRQNTNLQQRNQELELQVQGLQAASERRRLSIALSGLSANLVSGLGSRRSSHSAATTDSEEGARAAQIATLEAQLEEAQRSAADAQADLEAAQADAASAQANSQQFCEQLAEAQRERAASQVQLEAVRAEAAAACTGIERLSEQLAEAQRGTAAVQAELSTARAEAMATAEELREQLGAAWEDLAAKEAQVGSLGKQLQAVEEEAGRWREEAAALMGELADVLSALADARAALEEAEKKAADIAADRTALDALQARVTQLQEQVGAAERRAAEADARAAAAEELLAAAEKQAAEASAAAAAAAAAEKQAAEAAAVAAAAAAVAPAAKPAAGRAAAAQLSYKARSARSRSPSPTPAATTVTASSSRPPSPTEYKATPRSPGGSGGGHHSATRIVCNVMLPACSESEPEAAAIAQEREAEMASLGERVRVAEGELARQLADKQAAQLELSTLSAEVAALHRERELLQEQAVCLQQEVSSYQTGSLLRGGASGEDLMGAEGTTLERSPSRTLTSRMREMLSPRRLAGTAVSRSASSQSSCRQPRSRSASASASLLASPRGALPMAVLPEGGPAAVAMGPLQEGERLRCLQQQVATLEQSLAVKEAQMAEQAAGAAATLAAARQEYEGLKQQAEAAEAAAEAVLQLRSSGAGGGGLKGNAHQQCRATIEGIYAQMWRERLARQKAQVQATELRERLSGQQASAFAAGGKLGAEGEGTGGGGGSEVDEVMMRSLEAEMARADHLQDELKRHKAHQLQLQKRAEHLELQLAQYTTLLTAAEGLSELPCLVGSASPPASPVRVRKSPAAGRNGGASPVHAAISAVQGRKVAEEMAALRDQLKTAQAEIASVRRRERESQAALKTSRAGQRELEHRHKALASGLDTLQRLLAKRAALAGGTRRESGAGRGPGRRSRESSQLGDSAMAVLSALLKALQSEEGAEGCQLVVSPQHSEWVGSGPGAAEGGGGADVADALTLELPQQEGAEEALLEPLDISMLLPESSSNNGAGVAVGGGIVSASGASMSLPPVKAGAADTLSQREQEAGGSFTIRAVRSRQSVGSGAAGAANGGVAVSASASSTRSLSRIPAPPPAPAGTKGSGGAAASPGASRGGTPQGKLVKLLVSCRRFSPHATLSSAAEATHQARRLSWK